MGSVREPKPHRGKDGCTDSRTLGGDSPRGTLTYGGSAWGLDPTVGIGRSLSTTVPSPLGFIQECPSGRADISQFLSFQTVASCTLFCSYLLSSRPNRRAIQGPNIALLTPQPSAKGSKRLSEEGREARTDGRREAEEKQKKTRSHTERGHGDTEAAGRGPCTDLKHKKS